MTLVEEIAQEAGLEVMMLVCQIWGGQTLYIPDNPKPDHPIAQDIGYENLLHLVALYGGQTIYPPSLERPHLAQMLNGNKANAQWHERQEMEQELGA